MFSNRLLFTFLAIYGSVQFSFAGLVDSFWDHCPTRTQFFTKVGFLSSEFTKYENVLGDGFLIVKSSVSPSVVSAVNIVNLEDYPALVANNHSYSGSSTTLFERVMVTDNDRREKARNNLNSEQQKVLSNAEEKLEKLKNSPVFNSGSDSKKYYLAPRKDNQSGMVLFEAQHIYSLKKVATYSPSKATPAQLQAISLLIERHILVSENRGLNVDLYAWYPVGNDTQVKKTVEQLVTWSQTLDTRDGIVRNNKIKVINPNHKKKSIEKKEKTEQSDEKEIIGYLKKNANDCYFLGKINSSESGKQEFALLHYDEVEIAQNLMMGNLLLPKDEDSSQKEEKLPSSYYDDTFTKNNISYYWTQRAHRAQTGIITAAAISTLAAMRYLVAPAVYKKYTETKLKLTQYYEQILKEARHRQLVNLVKQWVEVPEHVSYFKPDARQTKIIEKYNFLAENQLETPTGCVFTGPPGEGKTTMANCIAVNLYKNFGAKILGLSSSKLAQAAAVGTKADPATVHEMILGLVTGVEELAKDGIVCIIIDEIDMVCPNEKEVSLSKEQMDLYHEIIKNLPRLINTPNVYFIATVNNLLDACFKLWHPHRLGEIVPVDNPSQEDREFIYKNALFNSKMQFTEEEIKVIAEAAGPVTLNGISYETPISRSHIINSLKSAIAELAFKRLPESDPLRQKIKQRNDKFLSKKETVVKAKKPGVFEKVKNKFLKATSSEAKATAALDVVNESDATYTEKTNSLLDLLLLFTPEYKQLFAQVLLEKIHESHRDYAFTLRLAGERLAVLKDIRETYGCSF